MKIGSINIPGPIYKNMITNIFIFTILAIYYNIKKQKDISNKMLILSPAKNEKSPGTRELTVCKKK